MNWTLGRPVTIERPDGTRINGLVWSRTGLTNLYWITLDNGHRAVVHTVSGVVRDALDDSDPIGALVSGGGA